MKRHLYILPVLFGGMAALAQSAATLSPTSLTFPSQTIGSTSAPQTVTLTNTGTASLTISKVNLGLEFSQTNNCGSSLAAGLSCTFTVTFDPAYTGVRPGTITITDNAKGSPQKVPLSGTGSLSSISLSPASLVFGSQAVGTTGAAANVVVTNRGAVPLDFTSIQASAEFSQSNTCGASIPAGGTCTVSVTFAPASIWTRSGYVTINDSLADSPHLIPVAGMGTNNAVVSVSPTSLKFGSQTVGASGSSQAVTLSNTGTDVLNINGIVASGDYSQTGTCGATLAASASCTINLTFTPSSTGTRNGYLTLNVTDSSILHTVTLSGSGTAVNTTVAVSPRIASVTPTQTQQYTATISGGARM